MVRRPEDGKFMKTYIFEVRTPLKYAFFRGQGFPLQTFQSFHVLQKKNASGLVLLIDVFLDRNGFWISLSFSINPYFLLTRPLALVFELELLILGGTMGIAPNLKKKNWDQVKADSFSQKHVLEIHFTFREDQDLYIWYLHLFFEWIWINVSRFLAITMATELCLYRPTVLFGVSFLMAYSNILNFSWVCYSLGLVLSGFQG